MAIIKTIHRKEQGQISVAGIMLIMLLVILAIVAIDAYHIIEVRNWAYKASQRASAYGVTTGILLENGERITGSDPSPCVGRATLDIPVAESEASTIMVSYFNDRVSEFAGTPTLYVYARNTPGDYVIYPDIITRGYPDNPARDRFLNATSNVWTVYEPSVAVAGIIPVETFIGSFVGMDTINITFFSATSVRQPVNACAP